jgi:hypothetical protein
VAACVPRAAVFLCARPGQTDGATALALAAVSLESQGALVVRFFTCTVVRLVAAGRPRGTGFDKDSGQDERRARSDERARAVASCHDAGRLAGGESFDSEATLAAGLKEPRILCMPVFFTLLKTIGRCLKFGANSFGRHQERCNCANAELLRK